MSCVNRRPSLVFPSCSPHARKDDEPGKRGLVCIVTREGFDRGAHHSHLTHRCLASLRLPPMYCELWVAKAPAFQGWRRC